VNITSAIAKKAVSKATFIVIARLDRAIQSRFWAGLKTLDTRLRGYDVNSWQHETFSA
jgi:hypothetical protein